MLLPLSVCAVFNGSKILIWKQITTTLDGVVSNTGCIQWLKDTNLKANHNDATLDVDNDIAVFNGSKILIWKQITTRGSLILWQNRCIQWLKDTNLKANHNMLILILRKNRAVFNGSKILIWKQITTATWDAYVSKGCIQWLKDTNLKANHNFDATVKLPISAVFNGSKILIWKQITTFPKGIKFVFTLYSMAQRY